MTSSETVSIGDSQGGWFGAVIANGGSGFSLAESEQHSSWLFIGFYNKSGACGSIPAAVDGGALLEFVKYWVIRYVNPQEWPQQFCYITGFPDQCWE